MNRLWGFAVLTSFILLTLIAPTILTEPHVVDPNAGIATMTMTQRLGFLAFVALIPPIIAMIVMGQTAGYYQTYMRLDPLAAQAASNNALGVQQELRRGLRPIRGIVAYVAMKCDAWTLRVLLGGGGAKDDTDPEGTTALALAVDRCGHASARQRRLAAGCVEALIDHDADFADLLRAKNLDVHRMADLAESAASARRRPSPRLRLFVWWCGHLAGRTVPCPAVEQPLVERLAEEAGKHSATWGMRTLAALP